MASSKQDSNKPVNVNERTYQEVEYLKKNLGPILVAALAEICIRRPADPIEYLGHWLLRWRYNEELKRRDVQNALDVVRQKQWAQAQEEGKPDIFSQGVTPGHPYGPPGYGGPLDAEEIGEGEQEVLETNFNNNEEGGEEYEGEDGMGQGYLQGPEYIDGEERRTSQPEAVMMEEERKLSLGSDGQPRKISLGPDGQPRKVSVGPDGQPRKISGAGADPNAIGPDGQRKLSQGPAGTAELPAGPPPPYTETGAEGPRKLSGPPAPAPEPRKLSTGSNNGAAQPIPPEGRKASGGPAGLPEAERRASLPAAGNQSRKSSGAAPGEARKASGGGVPEAVAEPRKTSVGERKASNGPAPPPPQ